MDIQPVANRLLVRVSESQSVTPGGIVVPDNARKKLCEGVVIAVGPGIVAKNGCLMTPDVKEGDRVFYSQHTGAEIKIEGENHIILFEHDLILALEEE